VTLSGVLKWPLGYKLPFEDEKETVKFIMKVYHDFKQTMMEPNIWRAFQALALEFYTGTESYRLSFNNEKLRSGPEFRELGRLTLLRSIINLRAYSEALLHQQARVT
jgi:hypothetical protein